MTTRITKPVSRLTDAFVFSKGTRAVVVTIHTTFIELRLKGTKQRETVDLAPLYKAAVLQRVMKEKAERKKARAKK